jgi:Ca2+-binding EF-hand superfamily protein
MWGICFIPIAVAAAGEFLGNIANLMVERRQVARNEELMNRELDMNYLKEMDENGSGVVDRMEYVTFMLKAMGVVEQDLLDELHEQFDRLDVSNSGNLGKDDLRLMAELRGVQAKA